ncbi:Crp/Fnr family transcriptional regulator [Hydrocarboniphaga sp.]|uniref:Crp/Fnr family transcriptional regulator n=1 Tax=Hydrocarboniphaga sp. TaxID=2033016 RepID=UPI0026104D52|nr:Crp/Fnr family transcriptional regulator [Hydrocarboniphaga sp.]
MVELSFGDVLCEVGAPIRDVYFPTQSFISLMATGGGDARLEVALIGNEGMLGVPLVLGLDRSPIRALVHGAGGAWRMQAARFRKTVASVPLLKLELDRYVYTRLNQVVQTAVCTGFHDIEARLARWLLTAQDRVQGDRLHLTHVLLAELLGVRRSGITTAAGALQRKQLIHYSRGGITILDRLGLEQAACDCYRIANQAAPAAAAVVAAATA